MNFFKCFLALGMGLGACSHFVLKVPDTGHEKPTRLILPDNIRMARSKIESYLKARGHYSSTYIKSSHRPEEYRINQEWMRDSSLRFYLRYWDQRIRHLSSWRSQWILQAVSPQKSELRVDTLEVLFIGLPGDADEGPDLNNKQNWFETDPDELRSNLELRRFWTSTYPTQKLPSSLANIEVPELIFEALSKEDQRKLWQPATRLRAF